MDYALIDTIARLTNTRPNWDREVTRAVGAAGACAIAALIRALGADVEYADLRGIELSQARPDVPDRPLKATNEFVRDLPSVKRIYDQEGHAIAHRDDDRDRRPGARLGQRRRLHRRGRPPAERRVVRRLPGGLACGDRGPGGADSPPVDRRCRLLEVDVRPRVAHRQAALRVLVVSDRSQLLVAEAE